MCVYVRSCPSFFNPMDYSPPAPLFMGFPRQDYQSGLLFTTPGDLADPGIKSVSLASPTSPALTGRFFTTVSPG